MIQIPVIDLAATGRKIVALREARGISVRDLQEVFGFGTPNAIYKWQHGTTLPTVDNLVVLAAVFGVSVEEILVVNRVDANIVNDIAIGA